MFPILAAVCQVLVITFSWSSEKLKCKFVKFRLEFTDRSYWCICSMTTEAFSIEFERK